MDERSKPAEAASSSGLRNDHCTELEHSENIVASEQAQSRGTSAFQQMGLGRWFRIEHEILLVGTRGEPPAPAPGTQSRSVIEAPVGVHSAKPECVLELIETHFPTLPKIELNRRGPPRAGWDAWGNEVVITGTPKTNGEGESA